MAKLPAMPAPLPNSIEGGIPPPAPVSGAAAETTMNVMAATPKVLDRKTFDGVPISDMATLRAFGIIHFSVPFLCH